MQISTRLHSVWSMQTFNSRNTHEADIQNAHRGVLDWPGTGGGPTDECFHQAYWRWPVQLGLFIALPSTINNATHLTNQQTAKQIVHELHASSRQRNILQCRERIPTAQRFVAKKLSKIQVAWMVTDCYISGLKPHHFTTKFKIKLGEPDLYRRDRTSCIFVSGTWICVIFSLSVSAPKYDQKCLRY